MKVLWISNAPYLSSGYGTQTNTFTRLLKQAGHEVAIFGFYGHRGAVMNTNGIPILPGSLNEWGNDIIPAHIDQYKPDVAVLLCDIWVYENDVLPHLSVWTPIDHDPLPPLVEAKAKRARHVWAMSRFGERQMRAAGLDPVYVPHGVETDVYKPIDRGEARQRWGVEDGRFLAVMVATNKGFPSRKSIDRVLKAWARFVEKHPDALLYIHTNPEDIYSGLDVAACADFYGVPSKNLRLPDLYRFVSNGYGTVAMNHLYNAADVLLAPSMGEGFGIPVIEAQAAGCPVIVSDFTAQTELAGPGYKIPVYDDDRVYTLQGSEQAMIRPSEIVTALEWAWQKRGDEKLRKESREFAMCYDAGSVLKNHMLPALEISTWVRNAAESAAL